MKNIDKLCQEWGYKDEADFNIQLVESILKYNFTKKDIVEHQIEILEQLSYEASENYINVVGIK